MKYIYTLTISILSFILIGCSDVSLSRSDSAESGNSSTGGSLSSFAIGGDVLYTINQGQLISYDISSPETEITKTAAYISDEYGYSIGNLETIFPYGNMLFLGASNGMYIVDVEDPSQPEYVSMYEHIQSCDPVVVQGDVAYVTLREGNNCWQSINQLQVIDISDLENPVNIGNYNMETPYGLGVDGDLLFVCDNDQLKVFDCSTPNNLVAIDTCFNISALDVIPHNGNLVVLGNSELSQYSYSSADESITKLSTLSN